MTWLPLNDETPTDRPILLFGQQTDGTCEVRFKGPIVFVGYWDRIDDAWCAIGSHWDGPFFHVTHWQPLPSGPENTGEAA